VLHFHGIAFLAKVDRKVATGNLILWQINFFIMSINHKFKHFNWGNGFFTKNTILHTPYKPEVIFIGTFNHGWDWNRADFFYGRDMYMWPILGNLFLYNKNYLTKPRNEANSSPTLTEIFKICFLGKITFADIVSGTKEDVLAMQPISV
jgi:hypothetical protein